MRLKLNNIAAVVALLLLTSGLFAEKQKIIGGEKPIPLGELVDLSLTEPSKDIAQVQYRWVILDLATGQEKRVREQGAGVFFGAGIIPKKLRVYCFASYLAVGEKPVLTSDVLQADIVVGEPLPPTPPTPPVPPAPPTPIPDGKYRLGKFTYESVLKSVPASSQKSGAAKLATSFTGIASRIAAGTLSDPKEILKETAKANTAALGDEVASWEVFSDILQDKLFELYKDKTLASKEDFSAAWLEIAVGFGAIK